MTLTEDAILENRYRIDKLLARGDNGAIYRAFDLNLKVPVAIKEKSFSTPERVAQFKQEALTLARLHHPALPRVIHHFSVADKQAHDRIQYLVTEFVEGENLWEIVQRQGLPLDEEKALDYVIQVCRAVSYLHGQNPPLTHGDIKPQNIRITPQGQIMLVDFGVARQLLDETGANLTGAQDVSPGFSPPEQYRPQAATPASDIYPLGATLYAILTGQTPPDSLSLAAGKGKLQPPEKINKKVRAPVSKTITHAMQVDPAKRPLSVAAWQQELEAILEISAKSGDRKDTAVVGPASDRTVPDTSAAQAGVGVTYWLVDATGAGYPVSAEALVIGRASEADIVVEDASVSPVHARIRVEAGRCLVMDTGSGHDTFINERRLGEEWFPLSPGELLSVGEVRFYLTATQPAKLASKKSETALVSESESMSVPVLPPAAESPARWGQNRLWIAVGLVLLIAVIGVAAYWLVDPAALAGLSSDGSAGVDPGGQDLSPTFSAAQGPVETDGVGTTPETPPEATATIASLGATVTPTDATVSAQVEAGTATPTFTPVSKNKDTLVRTATPTLVASTSTATPTVPAVFTPTGIAPVPAGPTVIPLESDAFVPEIGTQEVIDVDINPMNPQEVYALVKGDGIYRSSSGGDGPWTRLNLDGSGLVALVIDPTDPTRLYGPTWNAVLKSTDGGNTWDAKMSGLVANRAMDVLTVHPTRPDTLYGGVGETLVVSTDGGESWSSDGYGAGLGVARFYGIVVDPFEPDTIYVAGQGSAVYKSQDGGRSFLAMPYNTGEGVFGLAAHPGRKDVYLAGVNSPQAGIIKTENGWDLESVSTGLIYGGADSAYAAINYAPSNPNIVYAGSGYESNPDAKGVFKSTDGGNTWTNISFGLRLNQATGFPYYVKSIAVHPTNPNILFVATGSGLYQSVDGGAGWKLK